MLADFTEQLQARTPLTSQQVARAVEQLIEANHSPDDKARFLTALAQKGETVEEITAFALALRRRSIYPPLDAETRAGQILDVCGTGGDRLNTFNISTTVALIAAAAGVRVAKHGNRAITSRAGSADVLEALGIRIDLGPEQAARSLREFHFAFFFAPGYHPAFQHIGPARRLCAERGQRTIFNFLGPLLNPAQPSAQLMGVPRPELCEPIGRVLQSLGVRRGMVVCGRVDSKISRSNATAAVADSRPDLYLDEISTLGESTVAEFYQDRGFAVSPLNYQGPLQPARLEDLRGGDRMANAEIVRRILGGAEQGPKLEAVLLNAGAALFVAGRSRTISEGWTLALQTIQTGLAAKKLRELAKAFPRQAPGG